MKERIKEQIKNAVISILVDNASFYWVVPDIIKNSEDPGLIRYKIEKGLALEYIVDKELNNVYDLFFFLNTGQQDTLINAVITNIVLSAYTPNLHTQKEIEILNNNIKKYLLPIG